MNIITNIRSTQEEDATLGEVNQAKPQSPNRQGNVLTPYVLRHGYSYRASEVYGLSDRVAAANMEHCLQTHNQHYGEWFDKSDIDKALKKVKAV